MRFGDHWGISHRVGRAMQLSDGQIGHVFGGVMTETRLGGIFDERSLPIEKICMKRTEF
jgi:hypothetical protein